MTDHMTPSPDQAAPTPAPHATTPPGDWSSTPPPVVSAAMPSEGWAASAPAAMVYPAMPPAPVGSGVMAPWQYGAPAVRSGPVGKVRGTGVCILLSIVTLGIYSLVWFYQVHDEMKRHAGDGMGGGLALLLSLLFGVVMPYVTSAEVGKLYETRGMPKPVSGVTGLWYFPGMFLIVGPIVWFVKTNGALNAYWRSLGAA